MAHGVTTTVAIEAVRIGRHSGVLCRPTCISYRVRQTGDAGTLREPEWCRRIREASHAIIAPTMNHGQIRIDQRLTIRGNSESVAARETDIPGDGLDSHQRATQRASGTTNRMVRSGSLKYLSVAYQLSA